MPEIIIIHTPYLLSIDALDDLRRQLEEEGLNDFWFLIINKKGEKDEDRF